VQGDDKVKESEKKMGLWLCCNFQFGCSDDKKLETMSPWGRETSVLTFVFLRFAYFPRRLCKVLLLDIFPAEGEEKR
jgi:hypothetical protein